jgi:hypothetical protein
MSSASDMHMQHPSSPRAIGAARGAGVSTSLFMFRVHLMGGLSCGFRLDPNSASSANPISMVLNRR